MLMGRNRSLRTNRCTAHELKSRRGEVLDDTYETNCADNHTETEAQAIGQGQSRALEKRRSSDEGPEQICDGRGEWNAPPACSVYCSRRSEAVSEFVCTFGKHVSQFPFSPSRYCSRGIQRMVFFFLSWRLCPFSRLP